MARNFLRGLFLIFSEGQVFSAFGNLQRGLLSSAWQLKCRKQYCPQSVAKRGKIMSLDSAWLIRILIRNADLDPSSHWMWIQCGSGSASGSETLLVTISIYVSFLAYRYPGFWIRIGSGFSDFVDPGPYWESGSGSKGKKIEKFQWKTCTF
jgi:hypothetical protein